MLQLLTTYLIDEFIENHKHTLRIYCHNLDFDIKFLISILTHNKFTLNPVRKQRLLAMRCVKNDKLYFDFRDSYALLPFSIKELGKIVNLEKIDIDLDTIDYHLLSKYCKRDNEIVAKSIQALILLFNRFGLPNLLPESIPLSIGSLSLKLFKIKNKHLEIEKIIEKSGKKIKKNKIFEISKSMNEYFRLYYFGGKCECLNFTIGKSIKCYDFNSLYPFTMKNNLFPIPPYIKIKSDKPTDINENTFALLCEIDESNEIYPLIPTRNELNEVFFTKSSHKIHLIQLEEYEYLINKNCIKRIIEIWYCDKFENLFYYLDEIYNIRKEYQDLNHGFEKLCKLGPNNTYGKFAQSTEIENRKILPISEIDSNKLYNLMLTNQIQNISAHSLTYEFTDSVIENSTFNDINVFIALRVTALSRLELTKFENLLYQNHYLVYYTDTDSIFTDCNDEKLLKVGKELGMMKIEHNCKRFLAISAKEYVYEESDEKLANMLIFTEKNKIKGLKSTDFTTYINAGVKSIRPTKIFESWKRDIPMNSAISILKLKKSYFSKRLILSDFSTIPISNMKSSDSIHSHNRKIIKSQIEKWKKEQI